jgi:CRP-like cAMP-binding protein
MSDTTQLPQQGICSYVAEKYLGVLKDFGKISTHPEDEMIFEQGVMQDCLFIVVDGELDVIVKTKAQDVLIAKLSRGDCFGEISLFQPGLTTAMIRTAVPTTLWHLDAAGLQSFFEEHPIAGGQLIMGVTQLLSRRLRHANAKILEHKVLHKNLGVRSGNKQQELEAQLAEQEKASELLGGKKGGYKLPEIRRS